MAYCRSTRALVNSISQGLQIFWSSDRSFRHTMFLRCRSRGTDVVHPKKYRVSWRDPPVKRNIKMQTKLPLFDDYRFAVFKMSARRTLGVDGSTAPWQLKLQNVTLQMIPVPWQLYAPPSYTSLLKNVRFRWRTLYVKLVLILAEDIRCEYNIKMKWNIYFVKHNYLMFH